MEPLHIEQAAVKVGMQVYPKSVFPEDMVQEVGELDVEEAEGHDVAFLSVQMTEKY